MLEQHQREQACGLGLVGHQRRHRPRQPDRLGAEIDADQLGARGCRVSLVEQQVQDGEHTGGPFREQLGGRHAVWDPRTDDLVLGAHQPLGHRWLRDYKRVRDLGRRQARECP